MSNSILKILHLDSERTYRGGERQLLLLAAAQADDPGLQPVVAGPPDSEILTRAADRGIPVVSAPFSRRRTFETIRRLRRYVADEDIRILHSHTSHSMLPGSAIHLLHSRLANSSSVKHVVHRRVDFSITNPLSKYIKYRVGIDAFIAISRAVVSELRKAGIPKSKINLVFSGVPPIQTGKQSRDELELPAEPARLIGCVAQLTDHKGHRYLLEAMPQVLEEFPNAVLVLVGKGELRDELQDQSEQLGLGSSCQFMGFREDVHELFEHFEIFVMPSIEEGLNTSVLDAMAAGLPVVASRVGGLKEAVEHETTGLLVDSHSPAALATALSKLLERAELRDEMSRHATRRFEENFTVSRMVDGVRDVYSSILEPDD